LLGISFLPVALLLLKHTKAKYKIVEEDKDQIEIEIVDDAIIVLIITFLMWFTISSVPHVTM